MTTHHGRHARLRSNRLHPRIYQAIVALALWLILSVWFFFATGSYTSLSLSVVTGFILVAVGLPLILSRVGHGIEDAEHRHRRAPTFHDWASGEFNACGIRLGAHEAALQVLLPIAAVSFGMTLIGLAFYFSEPSGGG